MELCSSSIVVILIQRDLMWSCLD